MHAIVPRSSVEEEDTLAAALLVKLDVRRFRIVEAPVIGEQPIDGQLVPIGELDIVPTRQSTTSTTS